MPKFISSYKYIYFKTVQCKMIIREIYSTDAWPTKKKIRAPRHTILPFSARSDAYPAADVSLVAGNG